MVASTICSVRRHSSLACLLLYSLFRRTNQMKKLLVSIIMSAALVTALGCSNWNRMTPKSLDNSTTASEIKKNLLVDRLTGVDVDVNEGVVTLTGHLPTAADRQKAYDDAAKVTGVKQVVNHIDVP
jgi:osmotically-inducible protein OsmY